VYLFLLFKLWTANYYVGLKFLADVKDKISYEEWRLLGCYAVWLL
jgi:hypothetical protein